MNTKKRNFDQAAATWDENPNRIKLAQDIADAISKQIELKPEMEILDFGCGTGLLSMQLLPQVHAVTGVDNSAGMLDQFNLKVSQFDLKNAKSVFIDLDKGDTLKGNYDLVVSNMTLHHIQEIKPLINQFYNILKPGGQLALSDLDLDDGQFHDDNTGVFHSGFDRTTLQQIFLDSGLTKVCDITATEITKPTQNGKMRSFSIFLMTAQKK